MAPALLLAQQDDPPGDLIVALVAGVCGSYLVLLLAGIFFLLTFRKVGSGSTGRSRVRRTSDLTSRTRERRTHIQLARERIRLHPSLQLMPT